LDNLLHYLASTNPIHVSALEVHLRIFVDRSPLVVVVAAAVVEVVVEAVEYNRHNNKWVKVALLSHSHGVSYMMLGGVEWVLVADGWAEVEVDLGFGWTVGASACGWLMGAGSGDSQEGFWCWSSCC